MAVSTSTIAYALKRVYTNRAVENAVYKNNPLMALIRKAGGFTGSHYVHALRYRDSLGRSADFGVAQDLVDGTTGSAGTTAGLQFLVTRVKNYQVYTLETEAILAGRDDKGSLVRTLTTEVDSALNNLGRDFSQDMYRDGFGAKAQLTSIAGAGDPYTWTVGEAITNFEVGHWIVVSNGSTQTAELKNSGTGVAITSVNRDAGTFTTASNGDTAAANDWIFLKGDRANGAITVPAKIAGLAAWVPATAPASTESLFGVTERYKDPTRTAGLRIDISSYNPEEGLVVAMHKLAREGGDPSHLMVSYLDSRNIHLALGSKAETEYTKVGDIGFSTIRVTGPKGDVRIVADQNAPAAVGNLLTMDTWELKHLGDFINVLDLDGARLSRETSADRFEGRMAFYGNMLCYAPGQNARLVLPS
jgi:hypothetical protein